MLHLLHNCWLLYWAEVSTCGLLIKIFVNKLINEFFFFSGPGYPDRQGKRKFLCVFLRKILTLFSDFSDSEFLLIYVISLNFHVSCQGFQRPPRPGKYLKLCKCYKVNIPFTLSLLWFNSRTTDFHVVTLQVQVPI